MAIPSGVYHVVFGGALAGGEVWESGFWVQGGLPGSLAEANATANLWWGQLIGEGAGDSSNALNVTKAQLWSIDITITYVKVYVYTSGGPHADLIGEYTEAFTPGTAARSWPNQMCLVVSLRTGHAGRSYRGRMYLPAGVGSLTTVGNYATSAATAIADAWALCFTDWNAVEGNGIPCIVSRVASAATNISEVIVDTRPDIQRRRANKQVITAAETASVTV